MITMPNLTLQEAQNVVETKTAPRVTKESIEAKIAKIDFFNHETLTICVLTMQSGFKQVGKAAPADARNYDEEVGKRYAYEDAFKGLWHLEGYLLCELLMNNDSGFTLNHARAL